MFQKIDYENWDRRDIYEQFDGYSYTISVEMDMTRLRERMRERGQKFYPLICWIITKTANSDADYRFAKIDGCVGYYDRVRTCYTLRRNAKPHLFTHMVTDYQEDMDLYYEQFLRDKAAGEAKDSLYYYGTPMPDCVDVSVLPETAFTSLSLSIPPSFYSRAQGNTQYTPFVTVGRFFERGGRVILPVTTRFHHAVNDGYHAEKFFRLMQENLNAV